MCMHVYEMGPTLCKPFELLSWYFFTICHIYKLIYSALYDANIAHSSYNLILYVNEHVCYVLSLFVIE